MEKVEPCALWAMQRGVAAAEPRGGPQRTKTEMSCGPLTLPPSGCTEESKAGSGQGFAHALYHGHSSVIHKSQKVEINNCPAANDLADKMWSVRAIGCCLSVAKLCLTLCDPVDCSAHQASLSFTISWSLLKLTSVESVMSSNQLILCRPLLLLPSIFPSIGVFSNELTLRIRWSKYWNFNTIGYVLLSLLGRKF